MKTENKWNGKNALWMALYTVLYVVMSVLVCVLGSVHPVLFVCYQITAGLLVTGTAAKAFDRIKAFGAACCLSLGMLLAFVVIRDVSLWHCLPVVIIAVLAELLRGAFGYSTKGDMIAAVIMSFSTFGFYGQIWFNRDYTYDCAVEEMPVGYAEKIMDFSPAWAFPLVIIAGIAVSALIWNITKQLFKFEG